MHAARMFQRTMIQSVQKRKKEKKEDTECERVRARRVAKLPLRSHLPMCCWTPAVAAGTPAASPAGRWLP